MLIPRTMYLDIVLSLIGTPLIKVILGQRRSGKSILLRQIAEHIGSEKVLSLDMEQFELREQIVDSKTLHDSCISAIQSGIEAICIDEVQTISQREEAIVSIRNQYPEVDIFVTGSNSTMLSSQLTTLLRGRYYEIMVYPFSYDEYCQYHGYERQHTSMQEYVLEGGYAGAYVLPDKEFKKNWIKQMIDSIILRDIVERYGIKEVTLFREIFMYLISTASSLTNISNIRKALIAKGHTISLVTLQSYMSHLEENFLIYSCDLFDIHGKKLFDRIKKYYISDHALRGYLFSSFDHGYGKILENLVFMEAKKAGWTIYTGKKGSYEIDFVCEKDQKTVYIQVAYLLDHEETIRRELTPFDHIADNRPKYLVTMDTLSHSYSHKGIQHIQARNMESILM